MILQNSSNTHSWRDGLRARRMGRLLACDEVRERLELVLSPVLARREKRGGITHHLVACPVCRQEYEDLRWVLQQTSQGRLREPDVYPAPNLYFLRSGPSPEGADSTAGLARLAAGA